MMGGGAGTFSPEMISSPEMIKVGVIPSRSVSETEIEAMIDENCGDKFEKSIRSTIMGVLGAALTSLTLEIEDRLIAVERKITVHQDENG